MSWRLSMVRGLGVLFVGFSVHALGCASRGDAGEESTNEATEAVNRIGCPNDAPISTNNYAPPHAYRGGCDGPSSTPQAKYDGALQELIGQCVTYCGQSERDCGRAATVVDLFCVERDIGHRWNGTCRCR